MKLAVTVWGNRVSPVFDASRTLLIADLDDKAVKNKHYVGFHPDNLDELGRLLKQHNVSTLICGAITTGPANTIVNQNLRLVSFVSGDALEILNAFATRKTIDQSHMMPGCSLAYSRK